MGPPHTHCRALVLAALAVLTAVWGMGRGPDKAWLLRQAGVTCEGMSCAPKGMLAMCFLGWGCPADKRGRSGHGERCGRATVCALRGLPQPGQKHPPPPDFPLSSLSSVAKTPYMFQIYFSGGVEGIDGTLLTPYL